MRGVLARILAFGCLSLIAEAQVLPFRTLDVADGLPTSRVNHLFQDRKGFLWMATWEGLARWDGERITTYGTADGLPSAYVETLGEGPDGTLWVGTGAGLARFDEARARFAAVALPGAPAGEGLACLLADSRGRLWCGTKQGLLCARAPSAAAPQFELVRPNASVDWPGLALEDAAGTLWFGAQTELLECDGARWSAHPLPAGQPLGEMIELCFDGQRTLLVAFDHGILRLHAPAGAAEARWERVELELGPDQVVRALLRDSYGVLWVGTNRGLIEIEGGQARELGDSNGLSDGHVRCLREDRERNLWVATWSGGVCRLESRQLESWTRQSGLPSGVVVHSASTPAGALLANTSAGNVRLAGGRIEVLENTRAPGFGGPSFLLLRDQSDGYWVEWSGAVWRYPGPEPDFRSGERCELGPGARFAGMLALDSDGSVWAAGEDRALHRIVRDASGFRETRFPVPEPIAGSVRALLRTRAGVLVAGDTNGLLLLRGAALQRLAPPEPAPRNIRSIFEDSRGRLWIGTRSDGVWCCDEIAAAEPRFRRGSEWPGAASMAVWAIAEDGAGRICLGTARGLWRLAPDTGALDSIGPREGLPGSIVYEIRGAQDGVLWIATSGGLARLDPRDPGVPPSAPAVYVSGLRVSGVERPLPARGVGALALGELGSGQDNLEIRLVAPSLSAPASLALEYRLEGADESWSAPQEERSVRYAHLAPGSYRFEARARLGAGAPGPAAALSFAIPPPLWRRGWFLGAALACAGGLLYALHRARVRRLLALESLRRQIASDVHDDVGAGLAQIAVLTEVARNRTSGEARSQLEEVARLARSLRESMSDIVWAVDPRRDTLGDLVQRLRGVAYNLFADESVRFELRAPAEELFGRTALAPDLRRHLLLASKELLSNAARHSGASRVELEIALQPGALALSVQDDGRGFDPAVRGAGHGLQGLGERARALRGQLEIESGAGRGTRVRLRVPLPTPA
jgi:ligand-binding sensor domain-containing protein/signal transduction histidine kinase